MAGQVLLLLLSSFSLQYCWSIIKVYKYFHYGKFDSYCRRVDMSGQVAADQSGLLGLLLALPRATCYTKTYLLLTTQSCSTKSYLLLNTKCCSTKEILVTCSTKEILALPRATCYLLYQELLATFYTKSYLQRRSIIVFTCSTRSVSLLNQELLAKS